MLQAPIPCIDAPGMQGLSLRRGGSIGRNSRSCVSTAHMIRAVLFAIATAATLAGRRARRFANQLAYGDLSRAYRISAYDETTSNFLSYHPIR